MRTYSAEKYIEKLDCEVYPITLVKFLLNKKKILSFFSRAAEEDFNIRMKFKVDTADCDVCKQKEKDGILCRQHTSIHRVLNTDSVLCDMDTSTYFFKNEIFRMVGNRLVIVYCPHPKLITGELTDEKVRKVNPITVEDKNLKGLPQYRQIKQFLSGDLMTKNMKCWFNNEFSIITIPEDRHRCNWCLVANK